VAPDGSRVLFLRSPSGVDSDHRLYSLDVLSGEETCVADPELLGAAGEVSEEERAQQERTRNRAGGVAGFACDRDGRLAAFSHAGSLYAADLTDGSVRALPSAGPMFDPRPDPQGRRIAYVSSGSIRLIEADGSDDRLLVARGDDETEDVSWGLAEFIAAEEMSRSRGYWWSPDGEWMLAARTDRSAVPRWHIADPAYPDRPPRMVSYPAAGTTNVDVSLRLLPAGGGQGIDVRWDSERFPYLASVHWSAGGPPLLAVQTRDQRTMSILTVDTATGQTGELHTGTDPHWVDIFTGAPMWTPEGKLVRAGVADGAYRLFVDGRDVSGEGLQVRAVLDSDSDGVLFTASGEDPAQIHVYLGAEDRKPERLSDEDGVHSASRGGGITVLNSWSLNRSGPRVSVRDVERKVAEIASLAVDPPLQTNVRLFTAGERGLHCALILPHGHEPGSGKLPVLLEPYGGPHAQRVLRSRNAFVAAQWTAEQGFAVLIADGRGTPGRGPEWERGVAFDLAAVTLEDQVDALHAAAERFDDLDTERVAIRGWSYGGYLAALAVLRRPDVFHAAVAGAPVTDWRLYDTHYTERYLGHPDELPEVYRRNSLIEDATELRRPLLLIHGLVDDNVFAAHTLRLSKALLTAGRLHDVLPLTGVTHMSPSDEDTAESFALVQVDWLRRALAQ
jgi:dipeptidyl-peptidase-4